MTRWVLVLVAIVVGAATAQAGSLLITVPDVKDAKVIQAKDHYNLRTGQSLATLDYAKQILYGCGGSAVNPAGQPFPVGVAAELMLERNEAANVVLQAEGANAAADIATENAGWEEP